MKYQSSALRWSALWLVAAILLTSSLIEATKTYQPTWESIDSRPTPDWFLDAKFGIFIHWGVYSVPAWSPVGEYAEWYWDRLADGIGPTYEYHQTSYGHNFTYMDFGPMFKAELWDPQFWAHLIAESGAKYVVPTSKHHDGWCNWPSKQAPEWNSVKVDGPKRDIIGELLKACRANGIRGGLYYSLYEWFNPKYRGPQPHDYVDVVMLPQLHDLVNTYRPDVIWTDGDWEHPSEFWNSTQFLSWLYNEAPNREDVVVNDRWGKDCRGKHGGVYTAEYSNHTWKDHAWEANQGIDVFSYGLNRMSTAFNYSTTDQLVHLLVRSVSHGGNLLLNIGPAADGTIPGIMQQRLIEMGQWLRINGEAIYSTRMFTTPTDGNGTVYYTTNKQKTNVYAMFSKWPKDSKLTLPSPKATKDTAIYMLGLDRQEPLKFTYSPTSGMTVHLPSVHSNPLLMRQSFWTLRLTNLAQ